MQPLKESSTVMSAILETISEGVYLVDQERRILFWSRGAETLTGYSAERMVGSRCQDATLRHISEDGVMLCRKECPLAKTLVDGESRTHRVFFHHRDGHRVPTTVTVTPIRSSRGEIVGAAEVFTDDSAQIAALEKVSELEQLALLDSLTGIANRRYLESDLNARLAEAERLGVGFGVLMADIDHFKKVNDTYGHAAGDDVIRTVARTLAHNLRPFDMAGRWGGEEFLILVPNVTLKSLFTIANRNRALVAQSKLSDHNGLRVTVSIGGALLRLGDTAESLVERADQALYEAKKAGRNRVVVENLSDADILKLRR